MVRPGWRGDPYRHYLAAKGVKTVQSNTAKPNHYYSKAFDLIQGSLRKAEYDRSKQIESMGGLTPSRALQRELVKGADLEDVTRDTLSDAEKIRVEQAVEKEDEYLQRRAQYTGLPSSVRKLSTPGEAQRRVEYINSYQEELDTKMYALGVSREGLQEDVDVDKRKGADTFVSRARKQKLKDLDVQITLLKRKRDRAEYLKNNIKAVVEGKISPQSLATDPVWAEILRSK